MFVFIYTHTHNEYTSHQQDLAPPSLPGDMRHSPRPMTITSHRTIGPPPSQWKTIPFMLRGGITVCSDSLIPTELPPPPTFQLALSPMKPLQISQCYSMIVIPYTSLGWSRMPLMQRRFFQRGVSWKPKFNVYLCPLTLARVKVSVCFSSLWVYFYSIYMNTHID